MDLAILYWHFVDVVWVLLLVIIYIWGCAVPRSELEACADGSCALYTVLYERKSHEFAHPTLSLFITYFFFNNSFSIFLCKKEYKK
jgi:hypothetical protein